jgi:hypothetical protein
VSNNRSKKKAPAKKAINATFTYTSACCKVAGKKPPVERTPEDFAANEYSQSGLGTWRCGKCNQKCKVTRSKAKETDADAGTAAEEN